MYTHRHLILHLICASALTSLDLQAQERVKPSTAGQLINNYTQQPKNEQETAQPEENKQVIPGKRSQKPTQAGALGTTYTQQQTPERTAAGNRNDQPARVVPQKDPRQVEATADIRQRAVVRPPTAEARVLPGQGRRNVTEGARVIPGAEPRLIPGKAARNDRVIPGGNRVIPGGNNTASMHVLPGARPLGQRPVVIQRALPAKIVIDRRCASCPYITLTPYAISKKGDVVELDDGSIWEIRHRDRRIVKRWGPGDAVLIETGRFFSWSNYTLVNYTRGETVEVELSQTPTWGGRSSHWIVEVNPFQGYVRLEDGSMWRMTASELSQWQINDDVIIGLSKDWFSNQYTYVLINPRAKNRIIALFEF